jgi:YfiH family protein
MAFTENNKNGVVFMTADSLGARHAFTTRWGGTSGGALYSLNLGTNRGDDPKSVLENYRILSKALELGCDSFAFSKQVHKDNVRIVSQSDRRSPFDEIPYEADGLVTNIRNLPIMIFTADCVPVLLCDPVSGVIAAVHCGWRSTVMDILGKALEKMAGLGAMPENINAAIGPSISKCCFETGPEVPESVLKLLGGNCGGLIEPEEGVPGKYMVDVKGVCLTRLIQLGVPERKVDVSQECTMCLPDKYWSHRATGGIRGSQASLIVLDDTPWL